MIHTCAIHHHHSPSLCVFPLSFIPPLSLSLSLSPPSLSLSPSETRNELVSLRLSEVQIGAQLQKLTSSLQERRFTPPVLSLSLSLRSPHPHLCHHQALPRKRNTLVTENKKRIACLGCLRLKPALYSKSPNTGSSHISMFPTATGLGTQCEGVTSAVREVIRDRRPGDRISLESHVCQCASTRTHISITSPSRWNFPVPSHLVFHLSL